MGSVKLSGKGVKGQNVKAKGAGPVTLIVKAGGNNATTLANKGKVTLHARPLSSPLQSDLHPAATGSNPTARQPNHPNHTPSDLHPAPTGQNSTTPPEPCWVPRRSVPSSRQPPPSKLDLRWIEPPGSKVGALCCRPTPSEPPPLAIARGDSRPRRAQRYRGGVDRTPLPIAFYDAGRPVRGETLTLDVGDNLLLLTSSSADLGLNLRNAYDIAEGRDEIQVMDNWKIRGRHGLPSTRLLATSPDRSFEPIRADLRPRCLYDHLARLIELARAAGVELSIDGVDAAARQLDPASV